MHLAGGLADAPSSVPATATGNPDTLANDVQAIQALPDAVRRIATEA